MGKEDITTLPTAVFHDLDEQRPKVHYEEQLSSWYDWTWQAEIQPTCAEIVKHRIDREMLSGRILGRAIARAVKYSLEFALSVPGNAHGVYQFQATLTSGS